MKQLIVLLLLCSPALHAQLIGDRQTGLASYYSDEYNGAETAYGAIYNKDELVAAHKAYPYNSTVRVRNENNGKSVVVRIIDKGPFIRGRIVELSERAARELGMIGERTVPVTLTLLSTPDQHAVAEPRRQIATDPEPPTPTKIEVEAPPVIIVEQPAPPQVIEVATPATPTPPAEKPTPPVTPSQAATSKPVRGKTFAPGLYAINLREADGGRYGVQVGSFKSLESAMDKVVELQGRYFDDILLQKTGQQDAGSYKVILGPFRDQASAQNYAGDLKKRYNISGFAVDLGVR
ncbi:rare lipoprotein A [Lewinella aquimaris]|uniref:Probable endolytic peptidoglycan transglycosylase RlpA n=1 Tax=Neolewinella aquimaris TaxID=1835722 RepID=A0A840E2K7_9BACT|nr:septal ring lytic transglycosylase RlpA family protein [Neolewinella aquimaris]MBB4077915.1 rare lipoprotein A [Neolewinella aquimaris]